MSDTAGTSDAGDAEPRDDLLRAALRELAERIAAAERLSPPAGRAVLRSIVDATVVLFGAEAASIALHDPTTDRLVFEVAAGSQGQGVVGLAIGPADGVAGYVFSTGQPLALSDVASDARFGRTTAEQTGYLPRSLVAVPLVDDDGVLGVLEVLDKRGDRPFDLRDVELAAVFARQATVAIRSSRLERDAAALIRLVIGAVLREGTSAAPADVADRASDEVDDRAAAITAVATAGLAADDDPLWRLADQIARLRAADPAELELVTELLGVLVRRSERRRPGTRRTGAGARGPASVTASASADDASG